MYFSPYYSIALLLALSISLQFGYLFNGANRYVPLRIIIISFILVFFINIFNSERYKRSSIFIFLTGLLLASFFLVVWSPNVSHDLVIKTYLNFFYIFFLVAILFEILPRLSLRQINKSFLVGVFFCTCSLLIEAVFRFSFPSLAVENSELAEWISNKELSSSFLDFLIGKEFYIYKYSSIMFYDSNYAGLFSLILIVCIVFYRDKVSNSFFVNLLLVINVFLLLLTFSRAAVITLIFILPLYKIIKSLMNKSYLYSLFLLLMFSIVSIIVFVVILDYILLDNSFKSKIEIMLSVFKLGNNFSLSEILFGFGFSEGGYIYSYEDGAYAHSLFPLLLGEVGLIGMIFYLLIFGVLCWLVGWYGFLVATIFIVPGFSLVDPWQIVYFWSLVYMYFIQNKQRELDA